jgi:hypothetical protein
VTVKLHRTAIEAAAARLLGILEKLAPAPVERRR